MFLRGVVERVGNIAVVAALLLCLFIPGANAAGVIATIERVKGSIVAVGTYGRTRSPPFQFRGTGFAVGDGTLIATNAHVLPDAIDSEHFEILAILVPGPERDKVQFREARKITVDPGTDLALLKIDGDPLPALRFGDSDGVREGQEILFTGFPIGAALGPYPATHGGMVSAITPIAIPPGRSAELDPKVIRRLTVGSFRVFQLDATAYPGNSGSPVYDTATGQVLGVINMVFVKGTKESVLTQPSGITYAIPAKYLQDLVQKVR
jgi:S1-C subfamily serine protease